MKFLSSSAWSIAAFTAFSAAAETTNSSSASSSSNNITYAPYDATCPLYNLSPLYNKTSHDGFIRTNSLISQDEYSYISARQVKAKSNLIEFLDNLNIPDYNETSFADYLDILNQSNINIGLSFSGGGYRALFTGAGELMALDSRTTTNSTLKGLLDSSVYITGLSGGSILLSTLAFNNWTSVEDIMLDNTTTIWNTSRPPVSADLNYWAQLIGEVNEKKKAGFDISLIDVYGRILSRFMFEKEFDDYGLNTLFSDLQFSDAFMNYDMPFPMILTTGGTTNGTNITDYSINVFEVNPYEFGSFSPLVGGFIPIELLGSSLDNGLPIVNDRCTYDFDNVGFLVGASSNILESFQEPFDLLMSGNQSIAALLSAQLGANVSSSYIELLVNAVNPNLNETLFAVLDNPFYNSSLASNESEVADGKLLKLVDGGFFEESVPLDPILAPARQIDIVFAFDNNAETEDNWPNGDSLYASEERWLSSFPDDEFYELPSSSEEFVELGLNTKPVFFGCNGTSLITNQTNPNATVEFNYMKPLLVYIPNTDYTYESNITNYQFPISERNALIHNGFEIAQYNNEEDDFAQCVGCAIIRRSEEREGIELSPFCSRCFTKYCYDSSYVETDLGNSTLVSNITENIPTSIYSSSALPSAMSSLLTKRSKATAFPTFFPSSAY